MSLVGLGDRAIPHAEHRGTLDDEALGPLGLGQSVEETLHGVVLEHLVEIQPEFVGPVLQARTYRGGHVDRLPHTHGSART